MRELVESPVFLVGLTLAAYRIGCWVRDRARGHALAQPVLVAIVVTGATLLALDIDATVYADGVQVLSFWLGAATVALAVPLHRQVSRLRGFVVPMLVAIPLGVTTSVVSVVLLARWTGADEELALTLSPKAATTPVSIALSETIGGIPSLTAALTIAIGVLGAIAGPALLTLARITDRRARGLALGGVSHGIGASRALVEDETEGAFAGLSMGLTALTTSLLLPLLLTVLL
ncbi:LrgB family protein [Nocardioides marmotae]|uniref:LrgB family protein n=1 Tax=Nocardioides marmotae TaxID=2663857 RepID=A0A6I3J3Y7_9ACTN|nr:LrgB family protein [Nocardioides marmotae]MCR6030161.1 LrgB family protein [Gordonia jinghuaiqii]MBC9733041.1 LrgB family protein [Nocardioides marmotae]MTB84155.1 LrgB family protein [Nocardioides marmotae]MTB93792.1 LrgB family protein [Nocardioides marmotae]QKE00126.1 LrgB family protein [Nocardioides marmotae]